MFNIDTNNSNLLKIVEDTCKVANVAYDLIPLPEDLSLDVSAHIAFHGITMKEAIPTLVFKTENGFIAAQKRADTKIDSAKLKKLAGVKSMNFASPDDLEEMGCKIGIVPLVGLRFPQFIDKKVLESPTVYGGSGSKSFALKVQSADLALLNNATIGDFTNEA